MHVDADEWLFRLDCILKEPSKGLFSVITDDDIFRGYLQGYSFFIQRENAFGNRFSGIVIAGLVNRKQCTVDVIYKMDWSVLALYIAFDLIVLLVVITHTELPLYLRLLFPFISYLYQLLRFNYELHIATSLIKRLCQPKQCKA